MTTRRYSEADYEAIVAKRAGWEAIDAAVPRGGKTLQKARPANVVKSTSLYRSNLEAVFAETIERAKRAGLVKAFWYEPFSLWLPGRIRYKPDFLIQYAEAPVYTTHVCAEPRLGIVEVKGWSRNLRDGITRMKMAAALFPCFTWKLVERKNGEWVERIIQ